MPLEKLLEIWGSLEDKKYIHRFKKFSIFDVESNGMIVENFETDSALEMSKIVASMVNSAIGTSIKIINNETKKEYSFVRKYYNPAEVLAFA